MKRSLLSIVSVVILAACSPATTPTIDTEPDTEPDTTAPAINSITTSPSTLFKGHPVTLIVDASDSESEVVLTYDFDFDGLFDEPNGYSYSTPGEKTAAVKASSEGGFAINNHDFTVSEVLLDISITYTAYASGSTGDFSINYKVDNVSNVPIQLTERTYTIWGSTSNVLITETNDLPPGAFIPHLGHAYASIVGGPFADIPNHFYLWIYYNDGYGNASFEETGLMAFTMY